MVEYRKVCRTNAFEIRLYLKGPVPDLSIFALKEELILIQPFFTLVLFTRFIAGPKIRCSYVCVYTHKIPNV